MNIKHNVGLIGMRNGHELLIRYMDEYNEIVHEDIASKVDKLPTVDAAIALEAYDPTVRFVDYTPCNGIHVLSFGAEQTTLRISPMFATKCAYTVTLDNEDAYQFVRELIGCNMYHVTATPA